MAKEQKTILDFSSVKPFEPMDSGQKYLVTATLERKSGPKGPYTETTFTVDAPEEVNVENWVEDQDSEGGMKKGGGLSEEMTKAKGRKLFRNYSLTEQALPFLQEMIKGLEPSTEFTEAFAYDEAKYNGLQCVVSIENEAYDEQVRARVKKVYPTSTWKS